MPATLSSRHHHGLPLLLPDAAWASLQPHSQRQGLAAHLVLDLGYTTDQVRQYVLQWLEFARPDYYVAAALAARGLNPASYALTTQGSCYRGLCGDPISQGGYGGMNELVEPTIAGGIA
jgi:putative alpha-1,2-mannosidase